MNTRQTIEGYFGALKKKAGWQDALATDMVFTNHASPVKQVVGRDAYLEATKRFYSTIADFEVRQLLVEGDRASVEAHSGNGKRGSRPRNGALPELSKAELGKRARKAGIEGRSTMTKDELVDALDSV